LYLMDAGGGSKKLLAGNLPSSPGNVIWANDNSGVYYQMEENGESNLYFVTLAGAIKKVTKGVHVLSGASVAKNGQAAATITTPSRPGYLVAFSVLKLDTIRELIDINADILAGVKLGDCEELKLKAPDGLSLQGWLIKPAEFDPSKTYPMLLYIHGGPWSMYSVGFNWDSELRGQRLCRFVHEYAGKHWLWAGFRQRHSIFLSRQGL